MDELEHIGAGEGFQGIVVGVVPLRLHLGELRGKVLDLLGELG